MNEIIKIEQKDGIETVNARELHEFLEVGRDFSNWIKDRIEKYGFVENIDYVRSPELASDGRGGQNKIDYHISVEMAKQLSMVENNEKGLIARRYFIDCEKSLKVVKNEVALTLQKMSDRLDRIESNIVQITHNPKSKPKPARLVKRYKYRKTEHIFATVEFNKKSYTITPDFYHNGRFSVYHDIEEQNTYIPPIKSALISESAAIKWIERNM